MYLYGCGKCGWSADIQTLTTERGRNDTDNGWRRDHVETALTVASSRTSAISAPSGPNGRSTSSRIGSTSHLIWRSLINELVPHGWQRYLHRYKRFGVFRKTHRKTLPCRLHKQAQGAALLGLQRPPRCLHHKQQNRNLLQAHVGHAHDGERAARAASSN